MKKPRISTNFPALSDLELKALGLRVATSMRGNTYFPNMDSSLDELDGLNTQYNDAMDAAKHHDRLKISEKNDVRKLLETALLNLANYVTALAKGSRTIMISSGFDVSPETSDPPDLAPVQNFKAEQGKNSGEARISSDTVKRATYRLFYYAIAGGDTVVWQFAKTTKSFVVLTGLQPGKTYMFYMEAHAANEKFVKSDTITKLIF